MHPLLRVPYAALGATAELSAALAPRASSSKLLRALSARRHVGERFAAFRRDASRPLIWFHAASVGESLMAQPVLAAMRGRTPAPQTALTWFSPSAEGLARGIPADFHDFLPFDTTRGARIALDALQPNALVFAKLDVWPVLAERASARGVALALIAASVGPASSRRGTLARALLRDAYARLSAAGAASADDADGLVALGVPPGVISVTGDTRFDQAWARARRVDRAASWLATLMSPRPTLVAGSTWPADEAPLADAWRDVRRAIPEARLIVAPHEPGASHVRALRTRFASLNASVVLESDPAATGDADVVIIDRVGVLAEVYAAGQAAYVGGGFHSFGLHSVIEPAALGLPVVVGPAWPTSRDASALVAAGGGRGASTGVELAVHLTELLRDQAAALAEGRRAEAFVRAGLGATERSVALVERLL